MDIRFVGITSHLQNGLTDEAIKAAREIVFLPGAKNGKLVSVRIVVQYIFHLL